MATKSILSAILLLLFVAAAAFGREVNRVVGGQPAAEGSVPHQVSLQDPYGHHCGGSIIADRWILTAAHCVNGLTPDQLNILVGTNSIKEGGQLYESDKLIPHSHFFKPAYHNDIAQIRLKSKLQFSDTVQPITFSEKVVGENQTVTLTGWGRITAGQPYPAELQTIDLVTINKEECKKGVSDAEWVGDGQICTLTKFGEGACNGDSGGPLTHDGKLVGVVSFGVPCAQGYPDVYARVSYYQDWIKSTIAENSV